MSIKSEIERIASAKQELVRWLSRHKVVLNINASINELVELLDSAASGGTADAFVTVNVTSAAAAMLSKTVLPHGAVESGVNPISGTAYLCPANSMLVLYGTCNGGTTAQQAYPSVTVTGDMTSETVYYTGSNSSATRPLGIFVVWVGTKGGTVTLTRSTTKNAII